MFSVVYYSSSSENTKRFVEKISDSISKHRILSKQSLVIQEPFILITPTYADAQGNFAVPKAVVKFLNEEQNRKNIKGVVGSGNTNFGKYYGFAADIIAHKCNIPLIQKIELSGTQEDIERIEKWIQINSATTN